MLEQIDIVFTGATACFLSQDSNAARRRFACLFGLAGQPFWFYTAYTAGQWGVFAVCFIYAYSWARGFYNFWVLPWRRR